MTIDPTTLDDSQLDNLIENYRRRKLNDATYIAAISERLLRKGKGLDFEVTLRVVREAAARGQYISYGAVAEASGAEWAKVRHAIGPHLDALIDYCHAKGLPLLSSIVVNQPNLETGLLDPPALKGFIAGVRRVSISVVDDLAFLRAEQQKVFDWASASGS